MWRSDFKITTQKKERMMTLSIVDKSSITMGCEKMYRMWKNGHHDWFLPTCYTKHIRVKLAFIIHVCIFCNLSKHKDLLSAVVLPMPHTEKLSSSEVSTNTLLTSVLRSQPQKFLSSEPRSSWYVVQCLEYHLGYMGVQHLLNKTDKILNLSSGKIFEKRNYDCTSLKSSHFWGLFRCIC